MGLGRVIRVGTNFSSESLLLFSPILPLCVKTAPCRAFSVSDPNISWSDVSLRSNSGRLLRSSGIPLSRALGSGPWQFPITRTSLHCPWGVVSLHRANLINRNSKGWVGIHSVHLLA